MYSLMARVTQKNFDPANNTIPDHSDFLEKLMKGLLQVEKHSQLMMTQLLAQNEGQDLKCRGICSHHH